MKIQRLGTLFQTTLVGLLLIVSSLSVGMQVGRSWSGEWNVLSEEGTLEVQKFNASEAHFSDIYLNSVDKSDVLDFPQLPWDYEIFIDGSNTRAKNLITGNIDYNGSDSVTVINDCLGNLSYPASPTGTGHKWPVQKQNCVIIKGDIVIDAAIKVPSYTYLIVEGRISLASSSNCDMLVNLGNPAYGNHSDEWITVQGGLWYGNSAGQSSGSGFNFTVHSGWNNGWNLRIFDVWMSNITDTGVKIERWDKGYVRVRTRNPCGLNGLHLKTVSDFQYGHSDIQAQGVGLLMEYVSACSFSEPYIGGSSTYGKTGTYQAQVYMGPGCKNNQFDVLRIDNSKVHALYLYGTTASPTRNNQIGTLIITNHSNSTSPTVWDAVHYYGNGAGGVVNNTVNQFKIGKKFSGTEYNWRYPIYEEGNCDGNLFITGIIDHCDNDPVLVGSDSAIHHVVGYDEFESTSVPFWKNLGGAGASHLGILVDAEGEGAMTAISIPSHAKEVKYLQVWGYAAVTEADGMQIKIMVEGGASNEGRTTHQSDVNYTSSTTNFASGDIVYWEASPNELTSLTSSDVIRIVVYYAVASGANCAANVQLWCIELIYEVT